jgi:hypothetical protein
MFDKDNLFYEPALPEPCSPDGKAWIECRKGSTASKLTAGIQRLSLGQYGRSYEEKIDNPRCLSHVAPEDETGLDVAVYGECKPFLSVKRLERGSIITLHAPTLLMNKNIDKGDNLKVALNILDLVHAEHEGDGGIKIGFDEFHRMLTQNKKSVWEVLGPGARIAFYQFIFVFFFAAFGFSRRFAPPFKPTEEKVRTSFMQTETLSAILDKTGSYGLALKIIHRHTKRRWKENAIRKTDHNKGLLEKLEKINLKSHYAPGRSGENRSLLQKYLGILKDLERGE